MAAAAVEKLHYITRNLLPKIRSVHNP